MQFFSEYILGWKGPTGKAALLGTCVHKILEILAVWKKAHQDKNSHFDDEILGKCSINKHLDYFSVKRKRMDVDKLIPLIYNHYTENVTYHDWTGADYKKVYKWCWMAIDFRKGIFNPLRQNIYMPEQHFDIEIEEPWAAYDYPEYGLRGNLRIKGTIDLMVHESDDTIEIVDYKTGQCKNWATGEPYTWESLHHNFQLRLYHYAAFKLLPHAKHILTTIYYIRDGGPFTLSFDESDIPETLRMLQNKFEEMRDTKIPQMKKSWMCRRICHQGKSTFEDTNISAIKQTTNSNNYFSSCGETMCKCDQLSYTFSHRPIDTIIENMSKDDHHVSDYHAPGAAE